MAKLKVYAKRLKEARERKSQELRARFGRPFGYSQERLGIDAGIAEESASARMNQYERGVHIPDIDTAQRIAVLLDMPLAYFFCLEDDLAHILRLAYLLDAEGRQGVVKTLENLLVPDGNDGAEVARGEGVEASLSSEQKEKYEEVLKRLQNENLVKKKQGKEQRDATGHTGGWKKGR